MWICRQICLNKTRPGGWIDCTLTVLTESSTWDWHAKILELFGGVQVCRQI